MQQCGTPRLFVIYAPACFIALDVVLKVYARELLETGTRVAMATPIGFFGFVPSVNAVLAFSFPIPNAFIWPIGWLVVCVLIWVALRAGRALRVAYACIILGALSNLFERTFLGGVTDYLSISRVFPAFNIADLLILFGIGWMLVVTRRKQKMGL
ncbi:MAG: signal peptidase II [Candidatus Uhrbacteria bacterium]